MTSITSGTVAMPLRPNHSTLWNALETAPLGSHLRLTVDGVPESSPTTTRRMIAESSDINDLCGRTDQSITLYARGVNQWHPALVKELCSAYGEALWDHGLTDGESRCDIFAGEYSLTPGGIHREPCWNRHLVVQGEKCFYFWDHDDLQANGGYENVATYATETGDEQYLQTTVIDDIASSALQIRATPGCYVQWPNWLWHVARTPSACLSVNIASYGSSPGGIIRSLPIHRSNDGGVPAHWVEEYRAFNPSLRASDSKAIVAAVSASGLMCPPIEAGGGIQEICSFSKACRITNASAIWVRHDDRIVIGVAGQATVITSNGEDGARWLGSGTSEAYAPKTSGDFALLKWLHSISAARLLP